MASHFPMNFRSKPDLGETRSKYAELPSELTFVFRKQNIGPKVYIATADTLQVGTTCLHMDVCSALNVMAHSSEGPDGRQGAIWDLFRDTDSDGLRRFLRRREVTGYNESGDPIHAQKFYLNSKALEELYIQEGIRPFTIHQQVGDAVFIPAGWAHQVSSGVTH